MGVNGKQKGNQFERAISNKFSERFKEITGLEKSFRRAVDSGSFFGGYNQARMQSYDLSKATFGDIVCPENFTYNIECKFYKEPPSFNLLVQQDIKQWDAWIEQAKQDADHAHKKMLLIIKYNGIPEIVILDQLPLILNIENIDEGKQIVTSMTYSFRYKQLFVSTLTNFLSLPDTEFFLDIN